VTVNWQKAFRVPLLMALLTLGGLLSALFGDSWWNALSWCLLTVPLLTLLWLICIRPLRTESKDHR
jgi:hypothetical protein